MVFVPAKSHDKELGADCYVVIHRGLLLCPSGQPWEPLEPQAISGLGESSHQHYLGTWYGKHCFAIFFGQGEAPVVSGCQWCSLRSQLGCVSEERFQLAGLALQVTRWHRDHQFCGVCGSVTHEDPHERARVCNSCDARFYPRISPCVIGLVVDGDRCLLGRGVKHPEGMYSTLAGFIEPGENAEQALCREIKEEVGVDIANIRYMCSQPWPFPGQLMIGFVADYAGGVLQPDTNEILDARWFTRDNMPSFTPPQETIAGRLIQAFMSREHINSHAF